MSDRTELEAPDTTIIDGAPTSGGAHCETTALGVLLGHAGVDLSEPMRFGLGSGLSFIYWDSKQQELPFLGGRVKPFVLARNLIRQLGLELRVHETTSARRAWDQVRSSIDDGIPVGLQLDSHDLEYFGSRVHFAGHVVAMYGYDAERAYLVDTAQQGGAVSTSLESLARARAARGPMSARHRSFTVTVAASNTDGGHLIPAIIPAITACAEDFLTPPIANLGSRGIRTAARRLQSWFDRVEDPGRDLAAISTMMERAGTGGALFRNLYRDFLTECHGLLEGEPGSDLVEQGRDLFARSALLWTSVAELIEHAGATGSPDHLARASRLLDDITIIETSAMTALRSLTEARPASRAAGVDPDLHHQQGDPVTVGRVTTESTRIVLAARPHGEPQPSDFRTETAPLPDLVDGQLLLRTIFLSLDPYMRGRMSDAESYAAPMQVGDTMVGATVAEVLESRADGIEAGDTVLAYGGWQTHCVTRAEHVRRIDPDIAPVSTALGVLGMPGFTAYAGMGAIGRPQPGETVVVAAATGPVGSAVGQVARLRGARAVGIAGGPRKVELLRDLGFDAALDHRSASFAADLAAAVPDGVDVYFENVGGPVSREVWGHLNAFARVPVCGLVSGYNATSLPEGPDRVPALMGSILTKSLTVRGFIQTEFVPTHHDDFLREMGAWVADGSVRYVEDVVDGLENAPAAFIGMLRGENLGKLVVRVAD